MQYFRWVVGNRVRAWQPILMVVASFGHSACVRTAVPDPRATAREYQRAVERGDAVAVRQLLSESARLAYSDKDVELLLRAEKPALQVRATSAADEAAALRAVAVVPLGSGRGAELELEGAEFRLSGGALLPPGGDDPEEVLASLSEALSSRSLSLLLSLLTDEQRGRVEERMDALQSALAVRDQAVVRIRGEAAEVELPDGQRVLLHRERGQWRLEALP